MKTNTKKFRRVATKFDDRDWTYDGYGHKTGRNAFVAMANHFGQLIQKEKRLDEPKLHNFVKRLRRSSRKIIKPILVVYFTPAAQKEIKENNYVFLQTLQKNTGDKYHILVLPALSADQVRAELWYKGKLTQSYCQKLFENNIFAFHTLAKL